MHTAFVLLWDALKRIISQVSAHDIVLSAACMSAAEQAATLGIRFLGHAASTT